MSRLSVSFFALLVAISFALPALAGRPHPKDAEVYIISPADGATVTSPFVVQFGLRGMGIAPAGYFTPTTGHHHLFIDDANGLPPADIPLPSDDTHIHFGGGQTETTLNLPPGEHTLQLIFGDMQHLMFDPPLVSKKITVTVTE